MNNYNASPRGSSNNVKLGTVVLGGLAALVGNGCAQYDTNADVRFKQAMVIQSGREEERALEKKYLGSLESQLCDYGLFSTDSKRGDGVVFIVYDIDAKQRDAVVKLKNKGFVLGESPELTDVTSTAVYRTFDNLLEKAPKTHNKGMSFDAPVLSTATGGVVSSRPREFVNKPIYNEEALVEIVDRKELQHKGLYKLGDILNLKDVLTPLPESKDKRDLFILRKSTKLRTSLLDLDLDEKIVEELPLSVAYDLQVFADKESAQRSVDKFNAGIMRLAEFKNNGLSPSAISWEPMASRKPNEKPKEFEKDHWVRLYVEIDPTDTDGKIKAKVEERKP